MILSILAIGNHGETVMVNDISRAFFHARAEREVYVQLPKEDLKDGETGLCGRLKYSMYGTRDAAQNWYKEYSNHLIQIGFHQGQASPCTFYNEEKAIRTYVHGDDYVSTGMPKSLQWLRKELEKKFYSQDTNTWPGQG